VKGKFPFSNYPSEVHLYDTNFTKKISLASLPISQFFCITLPRFMAPHSRKVFEPFTNAAASTQILVFQCAATTQFTQSSYQTKKNISFLHTQCLATEVGSNGNLKPPPASPLLQEA
jgi:hypothetical protein